MIWYHWIGGAGFIYLITSMLSYLIIYRGMEHNGKLIQRIPPLMHVMVSLGWPLLFAALRKPFPPDVRDQVIEHQRQLIEALKQEIEAGSHLIEALQTERIERIQREIVLLEKIKKFFEPKQLSDSDK